MDFRILTRFREFAKYMKRVVELLYQYEFDTSDTFIVHA